MISFTGSVSTRAFSEQGGHRVHDEVHPVSQQNVNQAKRREKRSADDTLRTSVDDGWPVYGIQKIHPPS